MIYYIDSLLGADTNDGLSEATPWQSFDNINNAIGVYDLSFLFENGFEDGGASWDQLIGGPEFTADAKRTGDLGMRVSGNSAQYVRKTIPDPYEVGYEEMDFTFYVYFHTLGGFSSEREVVYAQINSAGDPEGASANLSLWHDGTSIKWRLYLPYSTTGYLAATGPSVATWYKVEVHWEKSSGVSDGVVQVKIDDNLVFDKTHDDPRDISESFFGIMGTIPEDMTFVAYYDDVIIAGTRPYYPPDFMPGDRICLRAGQSWAQQLKPTCSGDAVTGPIIFGAYGIGTPPKITGATRALDTNSQNYLTCRGIVFSDKEVLATGSTGTSLEYCLLRDSNANGFKALNAPLTTLVNCLVIGARDDGILADGATAVVDLKNCIVVANGGGVYDSTYGGGGLNTANSGTINYSYSNIAANGYRPDWNIRAGTDGSNNLIQILPRMRSPIKDAAFFTLTIDDTNYAYAQAVASAIEPYGGRLTFFVIPPLIDAAGETALAALAATGHEIAVHSWSHAGLTVTEIFEVTSTNTNPTIDVDVPTTTVTLWCDEPANRVTFNWSGDKTIGDLKTAVTGKGWTITNKSTIADTLRLGCLADSSGAQAAPYVTAPDVSAPDYAFWHQEVNVARDWIQAVTGVQPKTMSYPYGYTNAALQTWLKDQGYEGARGTNDVIQTLSSIEIYKNRNGHDLKGDGSEAQVKDRARHYFELCRQTARMLCFYVHNAGELSAAQWGWFAQELAACGRQLQTFGSYVSAVRASHTPSGDGLTYTKTYPDVFDSRLKPTSPCIDAGFSTELTEDIENEPVPQGDGYDIGPHEGPGIGQIWLQAGGSWKKATHVFCRVAGEWKEAVVWEKQGGNWERMTA